MLTPIATAVAPVIANQLLGAFTFNKNQRAYERAQDRANEFAREERILSQQYNSLENQFAQMQRVGMNPNLLTGQAFEATSPMQNQSVAPPQQTPAQFTPEGLSQIGVNKTAERKNLADERKTIAEAVTIDSLRDGLIKLQDSEYQFQISQKDVNEETLKKIQSEIALNQTQRDALSQSIVESDARTMALREETNLSRASRKRIERLLDVEKRKMEAEIGNIISQTARNDAEREVLMANKDSIVQYAYQLKLHNYIDYESKDDVIELRQSEAALGRIRVQGGTTSNKMLTFDFGQMQKYSDFERSLGIATTFLNCANQLYNLSPYQKAIDNGAKLLNGSPSSSSPSASPLPNPFKGYSSPNPYSSGSYYGQ